MVSECKNTKKSVKGGKEVHPLSLLEKLSMGQKLLTKWEKVGQNGMKWEIFFIFTTYWTIGHDNIHWRLYGKD